MSASTQAAFAALPLFARAVKRVAFGAEKEEARPPARLLHFPHSPESNEAI